jgi:hypothetical protein
MVKRDMLQKLRYKEMIVESGAKGRVIRSVLGLQKEYSDKKQLQREHFFIHYVLNPKHPDVRQALMGSLGAAQHMIYGGFKDVGQITHVESDMDGPDVIDLDANEPEKPEKPETSGFKPQQKEPGGGSLIDFANSSIDEQRKCLQLLCKEVGEDFKTYDQEDNQANWNTENQKWRNDFFEWLLNEKEKKA